MPYLAFNLNDGNEFIFDLLEERLSLGRNPRNEIVIDNNQISSFHAEFVRQPGGSYVLTDLKSSNGTFVNGKRVESADLKPGDRVRFGQLEARFRDINLPGPSREMKGPAPSAEEKRRAAESSGIPGAKTDSVRVDPAGASAGVAFASGLQIQSILPTNVPGVNSTIPKQPPSQIVARYTHTASGRESRHGTGPRRAGFTGATRAAQIGDRRGTVPAQYQGRGMRGQTIGSIAGIMAKLDAARVESESAAARHEERLKELEKCPTEHAAKGEELAGLQGGWMPP